MKSLFVTTLALLLACQAHGQTNSSGAGSTDSQPPDPVTVFDHPNNTIWYVAGQANIIFQYHPNFHAPYSGTNSLSPRGEYKTSLLGTLYTGIEAGKYTELLLDVESTGGRGLSQALGLAGFTNLDVVRNPNLSSIPYVGRAIISQTIPLSAETTDSDRNFLSLATSLPARRIDVHIGKFSMVDYFDQNDVGSDSHLQFMNWTIDNNGAYDYAADTRGYTYGAVAEFVDRSWTLRFGEALMPRVANGIRMVWNLRQARAENSEFEFRHSLLPHRRGTIRVLNFVNHANMGIYRVANDNFLLGKTPAPEITAHPKQMTIKYGFGVNLEQELTSRLRAFARFGWNNDTTESYVYTEVGQSVQFGADYRGDQWGRKLDKVGLALVSNAIKKDHQAYLALGGHGFLLGDGGLNYGRENIIESYYNMHLWRGMFTGPDFQYIVNPGYNRDRGPVYVPGFRVHVDF